MSNFGTIVDCVRCGKSTFIGAAPRAMDLGGAAQCGQCWLKADDLKNSIAFDDEKTVDITPTAGIIATREKQEEP